MRSRPLRRFGAPDPTCPLVPIATSWSAWLLREVCSKSVGSRPRAWSHTSEFLEEAAERDPAVRDGLLLYAAAVARDRGDHPRADALLTRALASVDSDDGSWVQEFELQAALADALVRGDAGAARARLGRFGPHPIVPSYPLLAEAAARLAEGRREEAAAALDEWIRGAKASGPGLAGIVVGNEWAVERLEAALGRPPSIPADGEREPLRLLSRLGLGFVGLVFVVGFGALSVASAFSLAAPRDGPGPGRSLAAAFTLGFAGFAAFGALLSARGIRGSLPRARLAERLVARIPARLERRLRSPWTVFALLLAVGWISAGGFGRFVMLEGSVPTATAWYALAILVMWGLQTAVHEAGHALAAVALGFRIEEIALGRLRWVRRPSGFRWEWKRSRIGAAGHVRAHSRGGKRVALRRALFVAAGPLASLGFTLACAVTAAEASNPTRALFHLCVAGAVAGAGGFLVSVLPSRVTRVRLAVDGDHLRQILRGGFWFTSAGAEVAFAIATGVRPRDWPVSADEVAREASTARCDQDWGRLMALLRRLDGEGPATARDPPLHLLLEGALDPIVTREFLLQIAMVEALAGDPASARDCLEQARKLGTDRYSRLAEAAVLVADAKGEQARRALDAWLQGVEASDAPAWVRAGNEWALDLLASRAPPSPLPPSSPSR